MTLRTAVLAIGIALSSSGAVVSNAAAAAPASPAPQPTGPQTGPTGAPISPPAKQDSEPSVPSSTAGTSQSAAATSGTAAKMRYVVEVRSDNPELSAESVRKAIADELGAEVLSAEASASDAPRARISVSLRAHSGELAVSCSHPTRGVLVRVVQAPASMADVVTTAAVLAGNLARDEAADLLAAPNPNTGRPSAQGPAPAPAIPRREVFATAQLAYPLATHYDSPDVRTHLDLNLLYGRIGDLEGLEVGSVSVVDGSARGVQLALAANIVTESVRGVQLAGFFNTARDTGALQASLLGNLASGPLHGLQASALGNLALQRVEGTQVGLFGVNYAGEKVDGMQVASLVNLAAEDVRGAQVALGLNRAGDVQGLQLGLVNVARQVRGVQLGLVNVADDVEGVPIGLVSVTKSGGVHPTAWASNTSYGNFGLKFATRSTYTLLHGSVHYGDSYALFGPGFALGMSLPLFPKTDGDFDIGMTHLFADTGCCSQFWTRAQRDRDRTQFKLRAMLRYNFFEHLSVFAGGGATAQITYPISKEAVTSELAIHPKVGFLGELFAGLQL